MGGRISLLLLLLLPSLLQLAKCKHVVRNHDQRVTLSSGETSYGNSRIVQVEQCEDYSDSQATYKRMSTIGNADCNTLLRYFDELNESTNRVLTTDFRNHLLRWGIPKDTVENYMPRFDPKKTGYITRKDLCSALNYYPNEPSFLKDVYIIESDAPQHQRESIIKIILEEMKHGGHPKERLFRAKKRIEKLYGKEWNIFQAYGGYWGLCQYRISTNLWFNHKGTTYGAFQVPDARSNIKSSHH